jgi:hypothetical protein
MKAPFIGSCVVGRALSARRRIETKELVAIHDHASEFSVEFKLAPFADSAINFEFRKLNSGLNVTTGLPSP